GVAAYANDLSTGPHRLFLDRISPRAETLADTRAFGDSLSGEAIGRPGDGDEFRVTVRDTSGANLALAFDGQPASYTSLVVRLVDAVTGQLVAQAATSQTAARVFTGRIRLTPGKYLVRVDATDYYQDRPILRGPYRPWTYRLSFGPEVVRDTFAIGDT